MIHATLTIAVNYEEPIDGDIAAVTRAIQAQLEHAGRRLAENGLLTGELDVTVDAWAANAAIALSDA
jgi:hypothetical protein